MNSAAWLRTSAAMAVKAAESISCTIDRSSASSSIAARMRCRSTAARSARRLPAAVGGLLGVVRRPAASRLERRLSVPSMALCGSIAASSSHVHVRGQSAGQTSRMCTSTPGSIARSIGQSHASAMMAMERTAAMQYTDSKPMMMALRSLPPASAPKSPPPRAGSRRGTRAARSARQRRHPDRRRSRARHRWRAGLRRGQ